MGDPTDPVAGQNILLHATVIEAPGEEGFLRVSVAQNNSTNREHYERFETHLSQVVVPEIDPASPPQPDALKLAEEALTDAWGLLRDVNSAISKLGLRDKGASALPHEVRIVAAAFSEPEQPQTPEHTMLTGNGQARDLMKRIKEALAAIRAAREGA